MYEIRSDKDDDGNGIKWTKKQKKIILVNVMKK